MPTVVGGSRVGIAHLTHAAFEVQLLGMSGNIINTFTFEELQWDTVGRLVGRMENDIEPGVDGARTTRAGLWRVSSWSTGFSPCMTIAMC